MDTIIGIEALKEEYRKAKLRVGDFRGLRNKTALLEKFGINLLISDFSPRKGERNDLRADFYTVGRKYGYHFSSMAEVIEGMNNRKGTYEVDLVCVRWNSERTDTEDETVITFNYTSNI